MEMENVPGQAWREAKRREKMLRPMADLAEAPADLVRDVACELNLSERWTNNLIRRLREHDGELTTLLALCRHEKLSVH